MKKANKKQIKELARKIRPVKDDLKMYTGGAKGAFDPNGIRCVDGPGKCGSFKY